MFGSASNRIELGRAVHDARWRAGASLRCFLGDASGGATAVVAAAVTVMAVGALALVVDHNWLVDQRDVMKNASGAAAVAATVELNRLPPETTGEALQAALQEVAETYVALNLEYLSRDGLARAMESLEVEVTPHREKSAVDVEARANLGGTLFSKHLPLAGNYAGPEEIAVAAMVESFPVPVEVVLAIDVSVSMDMTLDNKLPKPDKSDSRIGIVKRAASTMVDILGPNEDSRVAVGVVPWQYLVRLDDTTRQDWVAKGWAQYPQTRHYDAAYTCAPAGNCTALATDDVLPPDPGEAWRGCLDEHRVDRRGHADLPSASELLDLPSDMAFAQSIFPTLEGVAYECLTSPLPDNLTYQFCYGKDSTDRSNIVDERAAQWGCEDDVPPILTLTSDHAAIDAAIDALLPIGYRTYSALGVLWGQRLLTHDWQEVWGDDVHPVDPTTELNEGTRKAIVLLTDGEDNPCGRHDPFCETNNVGFARSTACSAAKEAGTEIFVVAAMVPENVTDRLKTSLRACSSQADYPNGSYVFVNNRDEESLERAFIDIAKQLRVYRRVY